MILRRLIAALLVCLVASPAWAGTGTITVLDSGGVTRTFDVVTDGSGHFVSTQVICDGTAAAQCAAVKAASTAAAATDPALVVAVSPNNTIAVSAASLPLPTGASTAAKQPALGTAGTASSDVITVQGIASMTALKVDGSGVTQPVSGTVTANQGTANATPWNTSDAASSATGSAVPSKAGYIAGNGSGNLTGITVCDKRALISETASAQIITGTSAKKTYICSVNLVTATAQNIAIVEGTGTVCATTTVGVSTNGTTAATGWNLAANGGLAQGTGVGIIMAADSAAADNLCILQSGSGQVSGVVTYTQY